MCNLFDISTVDQYNGTKLYFNIGWTFSLCILQLEKVNFI